MATNGTRRVAHARVLQQHVEFLPAALAPKPERLQHHLHPELVPGKQGVLSRLFEGKTWGRGHSPTAPSLLMFVGVDGYKHGWVSIALDEAAAFAGAHIFERLDALMAHHRAARVIAVDMPIALVDSGDRDADRAARQLLRGQASTIFNSPARPVLDEPDFASACAASERLSGKRISRQSFALFPKIIEVRAFIADPRPLRPAQPR